MSRPNGMVACMDTSSETGGLISAHIHGTHMPVEEPSIAPQKKKTANTGGLLIPSSYFNHAPRAAIFGRSARRPTIRQPTQHFSASCASRTDPTRQGRLQAAGALRAQA